MRRSKGASRFSSVNLNSLVASCYQHPCQVSQVPGEVKMATAFVVKREAFMQSVFYQIAIR
jgi:hypothetical protein